MGVFRNFPYSNFHEMNMDEILKILKTMHEEWNSTKTEWASYKDFIDNYFENLDVSQEVLDALRILASSGELNHIIDPTIATATAEWLTSHITPTTPVIDASLTISGAAADAKVTGERINNRQIKTYMTCTTQPNGNYPYVEVMEQIKKGDIVKIAYTSYGGQNLDHAFALIIKMDNTLGNIKDPLTINEEYVFVAQDNYKGVRFAFNVTSAESGNECGIEFVNVTRNQRYTIGAKKNIIFIGDSYTEGYSPDGSQTAFPLLVQQYYGLMNNVTFHRYYKGGTGFGRVVDNVDFNVLLDHAIADDTVDKQEVTDIIVIGGYNDGFTLDRSAINAGLATFSAKVAQYFPNAKFTLSYIGWGTAHKKFYNHMTCRNLYKNIVLQSRNNVYLDGLDVVLHNYNYFASDGVHPNQYGHNEIARSLINYLRGTPSFNIGEWENTVITPETGYSFTDAIIHGYISGENILCTWLNNEITFTADSLLLSQTPITIGSLSGGVLHGGENFGTTQAPFVGFIVHTDGLHYQKVVGTIIFDSGLVKLLIPEIDDYGTGWKRLYNVTGIKYINPIKFVASVFG